MTASVVPQFLPMPRGQLFSVLHQPAGTPQALLLICPPFFHEHARSYRLFSVLGDALAANGIGVLRFDYIGTGDSDGDDHQFTLDGACSDAVAAADWLRDHWPGTPFSVMGVRGGAHPALAVAAAGRTDRRLLWQPVLDGAQYVLDLERLDAEQRLTVPGLTKGDPSSSLMGFPCTAQVRAQLRAHQLSLPPAQQSRVLLLSEPAQVPSLEHCEQMSLPAALSRWVDEVDMAQFPARPIRELAASLASHLLGAQAQTP